MPRKRTGYDAACYYDGKLLGRCTKADSDAYTFCDKGVSDGICLNVVRDKGGNIEKLVSVDKGELEQFVK